MPERYKLRDFKARLKQKKFRWAGSSGGHEVYVLLNEKDQETTVKMRMPNPHSRDKGEIGDKMIHIIAGELDLEVDFFYGVIRCPQSHADICNLYRAKGRIL